METILQKENMDAVRELAATSMKISEAKGLLFKLQEDQVNYINEREKLVLEKIQQTLDDSKDLISQIKGNHQEVHEFCKTISEYSGFITEVYQKFNQMLETFGERNEFWEKNRSLQEEEFGKIRSEIINQRKMIEKEKKDLEKIHQKLTDERAIIESKQAALNVSYEANKKLLAKLNH